MFTPTFRLSSSIRTELPELFANAGCEVELIDERPAVVGDVLFQRVVCRANGAVAVAAVAGAVAPRRSLVVTLSPDLRRLPRFWLIPRDLRLVRRLAAALARNGAFRMVEED